MEPAFKPFDIDEMTAYVAAVVAPLWASEGWPNATGAPPTPGKLKDDLVRQIWALLAENWELGDTRYIDHQRVRVVRDADGVIRVFLEICDNWDYPIEDDDGDD